MSWGAVSVIPILVAIGQTILVGVIMNYLNERQSKANKELWDHSEARKNDSLLLLKLVMASAKLSYACAVAMKRGEANGEVDLGIEDYRVASKEYEAFIQTQAYENIEE